MHPKSFLMLIISTLLLSLGVSAIARAQGSTSNEVDAPVGTSFTYQGQLKDADGPVIASCDFQFGLWDALTGGTQVGSTLTQTGVAVSEGLFTVQLDFGTNFFTGSARWLETAVSCPAGSGSYSTLAPRQPLTSAPYSLYSTNAGTAANLSGVLPVGNGGTGSATKNFVDLNTDQTVGGVKTYSSAPSFAASGAPFSVNSTGVVTNLNADTLDGLHASAFASAAHTHWGESWSGSGTGLSLSGDTGLVGNGLSNGVEGLTYSTTGRGIYGVANATSGTTYGIFGKSDSTNGTGVYGITTATSGYTAGVYGTSSSTSGYGVYSSATATSGNTYGIYSTSNSPAGAGVYGSANATSGINYGVFGNSNSTGGYGVYGTSSYVGVRGESYTTYGYGLYGHASATSGTTYGVFGQSDSTVGIGVSGNGGAIGVYGESASTSAIGISGRASATTGFGLGVYGRSDSTDGRGVTGYVGANSGNTYGVFGYSQSTTGVGVRGEANYGSGFGVEGYSTSTTGTGVYGYAVSTSGGSAGVWGQTQSPQGWGVYGQASCYNCNYGVFSNGNLYVMGNSTVAGTKSAVVQTQDYGWVDLYSMESPRVLFEDVNTAQLVNGTATVTIDPVFAQTVVLTQTYQVFLTPSGDCNLFVSNKTPTTFTVSAQGGQTCSISFDYRIIAVRKGYATMRLEPAENPAQASRIANPDAVPPDGK